MKVSTLAMETWVWCAIIIIILVVPIRTTNGYTTITFNLANTPTGSFPRILTSLRNQLQGQLVCQIPVTKQTVSISQRFVLVELQTSRTRSITLAIDVLDSYVVGYNSNGVRANFLKDIPNVAHQNLWTRLPRRNTSFDGSYRELQGKAGNRQNIALGFVQLRSAVESVIVSSSTQTVTEAIEARFFIIAIQMIAEAARFKYIENQVNVVTSNGVRPNLKVLDLENSWGKISTGIQTSRPLCATISPALDLQNADGSRWIVTQVNQISPDMGLLKKS